MPTVDKAQTADIPALVELLAALFAQEAEFAPDAEAQHRGLAAIIGNPDLGAILVLREGEGILGMVNLLYTVSTALGERVALLEDMVIAPQSRGKGYGSMLLSEALAFARKEGCKRITLLTDTNNLGAQRFYSKHGFQTSGMMPMRLFLE